MDFLLQKNKIAHISKKAAIKITAFLINSNQTQINLLLYYFFNIDIIW
jgi:hypothetical protein